ncbi:MAG: hypothetical protein ACON4T_00175 [Synechococcus sp.]
MLQRAQQIRLARSRPPLWMISDIYGDETAPEPPVEVFGTIIVRCEGKRPEGDTGKPVAMLCPLQ